MPFPFSFFGLEVFNGLAFFELYKGFFDVGGAIGFSRFALAAEVSGGGNSFDIDDFDVKKLLDGVFDLGFGGRENNLEGIAILFTNRF